MSFTKQQSTPDNAPWWRFPIVWLVVGGPALVVVASLITVYLAVKNVDPVLDTHQNNVLSEKAPAMMGRNHSAESSTQPADR
ncbi:MAG: nitrogen fixation protein FixH [Rubrivivax sp.]|nr:MAG: nitrogen fixation protein FixH [Rubrivivax sp.]